ncbi:DUF4158 domain-containing protein [Micromonospora sp. NBC_01638]|uniref:DUF4158 domain-containing protein n=1 Tax=Micromonospora sp. NBC_01638 TaxID=2975982 RepID=UPI00386A4D1F|nr:DUF4158 domain-containing protein [Micromonospora sp. NBC_01638]
MNLGDLVEHWTLVGAEQDLVAAKHRDTQLGFALLLKFYGRFGRFPRGRAELHDDVVELVARQLGVDVDSLGFYEWAGRTIKRHRAEVRAHLGFRECMVADAEKLTDWLAGDYAQKERRFELAKDAVLAELRARSIEPPTPDRVDKIVRSGLHQAERSSPSRSPAGCRRMCEHGCCRWSRSRTPTWTMLIRVFGADQDPPVQEADASTSTRNV